MPPIPQGPMAAPMGSQTTQSRWPSERSYRPFVRVSLVVALTLGFTTGAAMLALPLLGFESGAGWLTHTQAHGVAQIFGWAGLFVIGLAFHALPRFRNVTPIFPWPQRAALVLVLSGVALRFAGQTLRSFPGSDVLLLASGPILMAGTAVFGGWVAVTLRRGSAPHSHAEPWLWAGSVWGIVAALLHGAVVMDMVNRDVSAGSGVLNGAFITAGTAGFLGNFILGVGVRTLPAFLGLEPARRSLLRIAFPVLNLGIAWTAAASLLEASPEWRAPGAVLMAGGAAAFVTGLRLFERRTRPKPYVPGVYVRYELFVRIAYGWLLAGLCLEAIDTVARGLGATAFLAVIAAPVLHVLTLGFISMMILGMGTRMLPVFEGSLLTHPRWMDAAFALLNGSIVLRLGFGIVDTPLTNAALAVSGALGTAAVALFAWVAWGTLRQNARDAYRDLMKTFAARQQVRIE